MQFSVLMSVYYKEKADYFEAALQSIADQTLQPDEVVIVKDGPLTASLDMVIAKFLSTYDFFKIVQLKTNSGLGVALNEGLKHCRFDVIVRADSDDISLPKRFERQVNYLENHPEVSIVGSNIVEFDETLKSQQSMRILPEEDWELQRYLKKRCPFNHMSVAYKKSIIEKVGSYEDCPYFEDYYLWCKVSQEGGVFRNIQDPLVYARGGSSMISRRGGVRYAKFIIQFQQKIYKLGITTWYDFILNTFIRCIVAIIPGLLREKFYKKALRI